MYLNKKTTIYKKYIYQFFAKFALALSRPFLENVLLFFSIFDLI